jgi:hypothetical protein
MSEDDARILGMQIICATVMLTWAGSGWGALNKCTGTDGKVTYTEQACEQSQTKTTVKITSAPTFDGQGAGSRSSRDLSPGQAAQCERARRSLESGKREVAQERNKSKGYLLESLRQETANLEQLIREQCN